MKCITYKRQKTKEMATSSLIQKCDIIINSDDRKLCTELFRQACGNVFYITLFTIPQKELVHNYRYTIQAVIQSIEGFMRMDANSWLECVTDCASEYSLITPHLDGILHEATVPEICEAFDIPCLPYYKAAMRMYLFENSEPFPTDVLDSVRDPNVNIYDIWNMFEDCIYRKGDKYAKYSGS